MIGDFDPTPLSQAVSFCCCGLCITASAAAAAAAVAGSAFNAIHAWLTVQLAIAAGSAAGVEHQTVCLLLNVPCILAGWV